MVSMSAQAITGMRSEETEKGVLHFHDITLSPLLSPINSYSTLCICTSTPTPVLIIIVDDYLSPIVDDLRILKSSTLNSYLCSHLSHIGQALV
jgi:hypothetical protein